MPRRLWQVVLRCTQEECDGQELISAGLYPVVRQVLDINDFYLLATEKMACTKCNKRYISWSGAIVSQLDIGHRLQFPVLLTYRKACDIKVVIQMRQRGLGNSASQLEKKLREQHGEAWLRKTMHYLTDCEAFVDASKSGLVMHRSFEEPPSPFSIPKYRWLMNVYCADVLRRIEEVKSSITSTFGQILKLDSTKKIVKKVAGHGAGTATWMTNMGNEYGEVLMSVLTSGEGHGLGAMLSGIVKRYGDAGVQAPSMLYVDRDCCGNNQLRRMIKAWPEIIIRLDIWHFMRRFSSGCTTESHQLYGTFMGRLSSCIFEWSHEDLEALKSAKRLEMVAQKIHDPSDEDVIRRISKKELADHCRRRTRGTDETTRLIKELLEAFAGDQGLDTLGVPLLDKNRIWDIWESQKHHIACIQDPKDIQLYTQIGTKLKGTLHLPTYRCARGSTSLESFHLHLNRFIPGTSASDMHFQAYLLDGLMRWNQDRAEAVVESKSSEIKTYSGLLRHACNTLSGKVFGKQLFPRYARPNKYTGELIGLEYLYAQTGKVLQDFTQDPDSEEAKLLDTLDEGEDEDIGDEGFEEQDDFDDLTISPSSLKVLLPAQKTVQVTHPPCSSEPHQLATVEVPCTSFRESTLSAPSQSATDQEDPEESVGPDNVEGLRKVEELAEYLLTLGDQSVSLTNDQAWTVVRLWNSLSPYDKQAAKLPPRYKTTSSKGQFMRKKGTNVVPGVEATRRCFVGQSGEPAQWPDCNRYMEQLIIRLCHRHPVPEKSKGKTTLRWTLVCRAYKKIREKIICNAIINNIENCRIQLLEINNATLSTWYNRRTKKLEHETIKKGIHVCPPPYTASTQLPEPKVLPILPQPAQSTSDQLIFVLPPNTAGQANTRMQNTSVVHGIDDLTSGSLSQMSRQTNIPKSTLWYRKQQLAKEKAGETVKHYKRSASSMTCSKCGKPRDPTTHKQYYGSWWCSEKSGEDYQTWREKMAQSRSIKKKK